MSTCLKIAMIGSMLLLADAAAAERVYREEPPIPSLPTGQRALVDDGSCPKGQIKEIIGGDIMRQVARQRRCIPRH